MWKASGSYLEVQPSIVSYLLTFTLLHILDKNLQKVQYFAVVKRYLILQPVFSTEYRGVGQLSLFMLLLLYLGLCTLKQII